ncbi:hypothetical protein BGZ65_012355 [Modicella reniformis]|uniref:Phosphatidate phosphatase APP1 catalytic domain-containing protein n=1 Tax=Modicella reniformis TaxID=1440133 RepID=A0A9P6LTP1_9FUNG|nr:hypothetical protein BGZ65_012355 [Modicella reniformis]
MPLGQHPRIQAYRFVPIASRLHYTPWCNFQDHIPQFTRLAIAIQPGMDPRPIPDVENGSNKEVESPTDVEQQEQHCLLFPTYATKHSRSGVARKLAGLTKENESYKTLESRFGMFLANNSQGEKFFIQCVGVAETTPMELTSDTRNHDSIVDALSAVKLLASKSLEGDDREIVHDHVSVKAMDSNSQYQKMQDTTVVNGSNRSPEDDTYSSKSSGSGSSESSRSDRWTKRAAMLKIAYITKVKSAVDYVNNSETNSHREAPTSNATFDRSKDQSTLSLDAIRTESSTSVSSEITTHYKDLGHGKFPTVEISSQPSGHFDGTLRVSHEDVMTYQRHGKSDDQHGTGAHPLFLKLCAYHDDMKEHCHSTVDLIDPKGVSVISDIDDTIKETEVPAGTRIILRNTFLKDMKQVPGMADVYNGWWKQGAVFHYVSNSPWQLIPPLLEFFDFHKFPRGSAHLRLHDSVLKTYFMSPAEHKKKSIREIVNDFQGRQFILIGDSGEKDLEIYTDLAKEYPEQIIKVFIRDITTARLQKMEAKSTSTGSTSPSAHEDTQALPQTPNENPRRSDSAPSLLPSQCNSKDVSGAVPITTMTAAATHIRGMFSTTDTLVQSNGAITGASSPSEPQSVRTPLELWEDRVKICESRLEKGILTLFVDAEELNNDCRVNKVIQNCKGLLVDVENEEDTTP